MTPPLLQSHLALGHPQDILELRKGEVQEGGPDTRGKGAGGHEPLQPQGEWAKGDPTGFEDPCNLSEPRVSHHAKHPDIALRGLRGPPYGLQSQDLEVVHEGYWTW